MRTQEELARRMVEAGKRDLLGFEALEYMAFMTPDTAKPFCKPDADSHQESDGERRVGPDEQRGKSRRVPSRTGNGFGVTAMDTSNPNGVEVDHMGEPRAASCAPGPWRSLNGADDNPDFGGYVVLDAKGELVADCNIFGNPGRADEQNAVHAHLCAAAPDMLEALELIQGFNWSLDDGKYSQEIKRRALAAIAKAEGR